MPLGDSYKQPPRVNSQHSWSMYAELEKISEHLDFRQPRFEGRMKRNRSVGSVQALIVELALADPEFIHKKLRPLMVNKGRGYTPTFNYQDKY